MFWILTKVSFSCLSAQDTLGCLRAADVNCLQSSNLEISASGFFGTFVFVPVVDGSFITERPTELLKAGKVNKVCWLHLLLPEIIMTIPWLLICSVVCFRSPIHLKATHLWISVHQLRSKWLTTSRNCFPALVLKKLMLPPHNMQVWDRILCKWTLS